MDLNTYPDQNNKDISNKILEYKEYAINKITNTERKPNTLIDEIIKDNNILNLKSYQNFINNLINPNTKYTRLLLYHGVGAGKTISALSVAKKFNDIYKLNKTINNKEIGNIFVLGFTSEIFKRELLSNSYFGILKQEEIKEYKRAKENINSNLEQDIQYLKELKIKYNKRRKKNRFKFIGYKEFYNKLFILDNDKISSINNYKDYEIINNLKLGKIKINKELLLSFRNSLIICDECHNLYNSLEQNNWGLSIQIILDYYDNKSVEGYNSVRCLFLSATPLTNNPIEVISIVNLLSSKDKKIKKTDLFKKDKLVSNWRTVITTSIIGKISYLQNRD